MEEYIGLDVSLKETTISIRRGGKRIWRGKCKSDPDGIITCSLSMRPTPDGSSLRPVPFRYGFIMRRPMQGVR